MPRVADARQAMFSHSVFPSISAPVILCCVFDDSNVIDNILELVCESDSLILKGFRLFLIFRSSY